MPSTNGPTAFVIMPFGSKPQEEIMFDRYYRMFKDTLEQTGFTVCRSDEITSAQEIMADIAKAIHLNDLIVADLTNTNPNVMYELGVAHTLCKPTIILTQNDLSTLPFDTKHYRTIPYSEDTGDLLAACHALHKTAKAFLDGEDVFNNQICRSLGQIGAQQQSSARDSADENDAEGIEDDLVQARSQQDFSLSAQFGSLDHPRTAGWQVSPSTPPYDFYVIDIDGYLPGLAGIYIFAHEETSESWLPLFVGRADNLQQATPLAYSFLRDNTESFDPSHIHFMIHSDSDSRSSMVNSLIDSHRPRFNSSQFTEFP